MRAGLLIVSLLLLVGSVWVGEVLPGHVAIDVPRVDGDWWQIAPNAPSDLGPLATGKENACDFTIFRAGDGTWRCIACVRGTAAPGERLFYQWSAPALTDKDWKPLGILEVERGPRLPTTQPTSVQAPHHVLYEGKHYLFYNSAGARAVVSDDGLHWQQFHGADGESMLFQMGRDVCVFRDGNRWIAYYCGNLPGGHGAGAMMARTADALAGPWSKQELIIRSAGNPESPFILKRDGLYYLWQQLAVYVSTDPLDFQQAPLINHLTDVWYGGKWAPDILQDGAQWYVAGYGRGIYLAKLTWERRSADQIATWRTRWLAYLDREAARRAAASRPTTSPVQP
jgi:hypothetical protein